MTKVDCRIPVISDPGELNIPWRTLQTIIAGSSLIDTNELNVDNLDEAEKFLVAYGLQSRKDAGVLLSTAIDYAETVLLAGSGIFLPKKIYTLTLPELMVAASAEFKSAISEWSCVILKICHAVAHAKWTRDEDACNAALLKVNTRLQSVIIESADGIWIGDDSCRIPVLEYSVKSNKKFYRIVTKLLLKEGNLSAGIFDHIGVRIVTSDIFSAILLIKFLRSRHIFMYANLLPQKSRNSMAEFDQIEELFSEFCPPVDYAVGEEIRHIEPGKINPYSSKDFNMIKIIERVLVTTDSGRKVFFPCEFQILSRQPQQSALKKQSNHASYEKRQIKGVINRLLKGTSLWRETARI